ncbi:MAG: ROK family protein [Candidatus Baldrarchaeia archaeon]
MSNMFVVGVDLGATWVRVALSNENGNILRKLSEKTYKGENGEKISEQILNMIFKLIEKTGVTSISAVGIGSIGPLDIKRGVIVKPANLPFENVPLVEPISSKLNVPVYLVNDCTAAVIGEHKFGAGKDLDNLVYVTLSTGIGGGVYVDGRLLLGKDSNAIEISHTVINFEDRLKSVLYI